MLSSNFVCTCTLFLILYWLKLLKFYTTIGLYWSSWRSLFVFHCMLVKFYIASKLDERPKGSTLSLVPDTISIFTVSSLPWNRHGIQGRFKSNVLLLMSSNPENYDFNPLKRPIIPPLEFICHEVRLSVT